VKDDSQIEGAKIKIKKSKLKSQKAKSEGETNFEPE